MATRLLGIHKCKTKEIIFGLIRNEYYISFAFFLKALKSSMYKGETDAKTNKHKYQIKVGWPPLNLELIYALILRVSPNFYYKLLFRSIRANYRVCNVTS